MIQQPKQQQQHYFLLFVNSRSGGRKGSQYLTLGQNKVKFRSKEGFYVYVYVYDLFSQSQRTKGFQNALHLSQTSSNVNLIICGGDGTVLWVVNEAVKANINLDHVYFGIIPIGTGNDFSRSLGWGGSPINCDNNNIRELRKIIQKWLLASKQKFDLWDVEISTYDHGTIVNSSSTVSQQKTKVVSKTFSNYLGIGIDARVSYYFEKNRTQSKLLNLTIYGCLGFIFCLKKTQKINDALAEFSESQSQNNNPNSASNSLDTQQSAPKKNKISLIETNLSAQYSQVKLKKGYTGIVCLNCTSYMSGVMNIWNTKKIASKNKTHSNFVQQSFNDGKIEFVGFKNQLALGLQRLIHTAGRVAQGEGPFSLKFQQNKATKQTFVQIDGQAVIVSGLKEIKISKSKLVKGGQIQVLVHR